MISRYNNFMTDLLLERMINETYIYYSPDLVKVLKRIDNEISKDLLSISKTDIKPDVTFVNLDPGKEEYLSFTTARNAGNNISKIWTHTGPDEWFSSVLNNSDLEAIWKAHQANKEGDVYSKSRNSLRIGRFINKVFPGKYNDKQIEEFVNSFKASLESGDKFEIVEGDEIALWYNYRNYLEVKGSLGNSCMKEKSYNIFNIYTKNPEVCRMLILKDGDKITGRALIWKLASIKRSGKEVEGVEYFLDRQYTIDDSDVVKFRNYAKEQGWAYKAHNNHHSLDPIIFNDDEFNADMTVQLKETSKGTYDYMNYPYVDTFRRYNPDTGVLYNDEESDESYQGNYLLQSTDGRYEEIEGGVWSEWYDRRIPEDEAIWSDWADSYLDRDRVVHVEDGSRRYRGVYPDDCDDIVFDEWNDIYIHIDDSVYSDAYGYSILAEDAVQVIPDIDSDGEAESYDDNWYHRRDDDIIDLDYCHHMTWFEILSDKFGNWRYGEYIVDNVMTKNFNDEWIPKMYAIETYKVLDPKQNPVDLGGIEYLTEVDADILGYEIDKEKPETIDQFHYHKDLEPILPKLYKRLSDEWIKASQEVSGKGQLRIKFKDFNEDDYIKSKWDIIKKYGDRLEQLEDDEFIEIDPEKITITRLDIADDLARN